MFKRFVYIFLGLVVTWFVIGGNAYSQNIPTFNYNSLPDGVNASTGNSKVCPSIAGTPSFSTFQVEVFTTDAGATWFEWVVYGGTITDNNGSTPSNGANAPQNVSGVPYFYISHDNYISGANSTITVRWHTADVTAGWVAVRQHSEWGCYAGPWSVYVNDIFNQKPVFDTFPTDITIAFGDRLSFILPEPDASDPDANCPLAPTLTYQVTGASTYGPTVSTDNASRTIDLGIGVNTITWRIFDGMKDSVRTYRITVDPQPEITHIAWIDPMCAGGAFGSLYVSDTLNHTFVAPLQYSRDGGAFSSARYYGGLSAGVHTLQAHVVYNVDKDFNGTPEQTIQLSPLYTGTLTDPATYAVDAVPAQGSADVTIVEPTCASSSDGYIYVSPTNMVPQNRSFAFNGSSDHIKLHKAYNSAFSAFSVAAWIKVPNVSLTTGVIVSFDNARYFQLLVSTSTAGGISRLRFETVTPSGALETVEPTTKINDGKWHLVVATFNAGAKRVYIDGVPTSVTSASNTVGRAVSASYGCIGARMASSSFGSAPAGDYFRGNMTDLGIWESTAIDSAAVVNIMKSGIGSAGPTAYWILNDLPSQVSPAQSTIFSDILNQGNYEEWGRISGGSLSNNNAPVLYNWDPDSYPDTELKDIPSGDYDFSVLDVFGCSSSAVTRTYTLTNNDQNPPLILVNMALINHVAQRGRATQSGTGTNGSCGAAPAYLAVDGNLDNATSNCVVSLTDGGTEEWWQIDLGATPNIRQVRITHASTGAPTDFYVMISQSAMNSLGDTARANVSEHHFVGTPDPVQTFNFNSNARYVRINVVGAGALSLAEVEALAPRPASPVFTRTLYLGDDDCSYVVGSLDGSIDPVAYDNCGSIAQFYHDVSGLDFNYSLYGMEFPLAATPTPVEWTVIDDSPDTTLMTINYLVVDTVLPRFVPADIRNGDRDTITWCDVTAGYKVPIPNATDNYNCPVGMVPDYNFKSLRLRIDGSTYRLLDNTDPLPTNDYDPLDPDDSLDIDPAYLKDNLNHPFIWEVTDYSNLVKRDTFYVYVQTKPQIIELKSAPTSCFGTNDGIININSISAQSGEAVTYYLRTATDTLSQGSPLFSGLSPNTYYAWIEVNGCKSAEYFNGSPIHITEPVDISPVVNINPVPCFGDSGDVEIYLTSTKQLLHLLGGANSVIVAPNYAALDLTSSGTVEAMVYFDTLTNAGINSDAGIVWYSGGGGYGLRMVNGLLTFTVGGVTLTAPGGISERQWIHIAGTWSAAETRLYIDGTSVASGGPASNGGTGGSLYMGCLGTGPEETNLHGFVRFVRVWNSTLTMAQMINNIRFVDPINYASSLVANFPININQGTQLQNRSPYIIPASLVTGNAEWQAYAYHWEGVTNIFVKRTEDLMDVPAQQYHFYISAPYGCAWDSIITLEMNDKTSPTLHFYNEDHININLDDKLHRNTGQTTSAAWITLPDLINVAGDCQYTAQGGEFDPVIDDHGCPASQVTVTWAYSDSSFYGNSGLNLRAFTDTTVVNWQATDRAGNPPTNKTISYYIRDNEAPVLSYRDSTVNADPGACAYRVPNATTFVPTFTDNCTGGTLTNYYPGGGFGSNLNGVNIPVGVHNILWIYRDKWGMADTITQRITVVDNQPPTANCLNITVDLDATGVASIDSSFIDNSSGDNCNRVQNIHIIKNIAVNYSSTNSSAVEPNSCGLTDPQVRNNAVDGDISPLLTDCSSFLSAVGNNPYWWVRLNNPQKIIYGIRLYNVSGAGSPLTDFTVDVSTNIGFSNIVYTTTYNGAAVSGSIDFTIPDGVVGGPTGTFVRVTRNGNGVQLALAEVEVYGTDYSGDASQLAFSCSDVRYSGTPGIFDPINVLLRVTDQADNLATCWSNVTLRDVTPPEVTPTNATVYLDQTGQVQVLGSQVLSSATDACGVDSSWVVPSTFDCGDVGSQPVRLWVRDVNGNRASQSASVIVRDTISPSITPASNIELPLGPDGYYVINPSRDLTARVSDNCTDSIHLVYSSNPDTVFCANRGALTVALSVTDENGNTRTRNVSTNVVDLLPPTAVVNAYTLTVGSDGNDTLLFSDLIADTLIQDNCGTIGRKWIMYNQANGWCLVPNEGTGAAGAYSNIASSVNNYGSSSASYAGTALNNLHDNATANNLSDVYISDANTGTRSVYYYFSSSYQFNRSNIMWHSATLATNTDISTNDGTIDYNGITNSETAYGTNPNYYLGNLNDGDLNTSATGTYVTNGTSQNGVWLEVVYDFNASRYVTSTTIEWSSNIDLAPTGGGAGPEDVRAPDNVQLYYTTNGTSWTQFGATVAVTGNSTTFTGINQNTTQLRIRFERTSNNNNRRRIGIDEWTVYSNDATLDCIIPTSNSLYYLNSSSVWVSLGSFGTTGPTTYNTLNFGPITTNAFRVDMATSSNRRVGIREWQVEGRPVASNPACTTYDCGDVNTTASVWLKWEDEALNADSVQTTVDIIPYFETTNIQIRDCGFSGEVFNPTIEGRVGSRTYTYAWSTTTRPTVPAAWPWSSTAAYAYPFDNGTYSLTSTQQTPMVQNRGIGGGENAIISGFYEVNLAVSDDHGCVNNFPYGFTWRSTNGGGADSEKTDSVCIGEVKVYTATDPGNTTYWDSIHYDWYSDAQVSITDGGGGTEDWAEFTFSTAGTYEYGYTQTGYQHDIRNGYPVTVAVNTNVNCGTGINWWDNDPCALVVSTNPNILGPLITSNHTFNAGETYVRLPRDPGWYQCLEGVNYTGTIYDVPTPVLQPTSDVCVLDTVWYHTTTEYDHYKWAWTNGRRLSDGNWDDDSIRIIWNSYPNVPTVKVVGYNPLDCADSVTITMGYTGSGAPVLDCSGMDTTHINTANAPYYTFQNLPPPIMTDDCHNRIANYSNNFNGGLNAAGRYDVGTTTVIWSATDYNGNTGTCSHTVTVTDNEPPRFNKYPTDTTLVADGACQHVMLGTGKDVSGTDNDPGNVVTATADIDYYDDGGGTVWDVVGLTTLNDVANAHPFPAGASRVRWILSDNVVPTANTDTTYFMVYVVDRTAPSFNALPDIPLTSSTGLCASDDNVTPPDASVYCSDNCPGVISIRFVRRSDGLPLDDPFPVGITTITWEASDGALPSNKQQQTQRVVVTDIQKPGLVPMGNASITACEITGHRLQIPSSSDNCQVDTLIVTIVDGAAYNYADTITVAGFNPYGDGKTGTIPVLSDNTNYTVTWRAIDHSRNDSSIVNNLRVELQPTFPLDSIYSSDVTCGGANDGVIIINGVNAEGGATIEYSISGGSTWQINNNRFTGLTINTYGVMVRVNGCTSELVEERIEGPIAYVLDGVVNQPYCEEGTDGEVDVIMMGGSPAQLALSGSGSTVASYANIRGEAVGMIEAWIYLFQDSLSAGIISKSGSYQLGLLNGRVMLQINGTTWLGDATGTTGVGTVLEDNRWYHIAGSWMAGGALEIYINGGLQAGTLHNGPVPTVNQNGNDLVIGSGFNGIIREARVWNETYGAVVTYLGGSPANVKISGGETYLGGCWPLTDGVSPSSNKFSGSNANTGGLWTTTLPQPGNYHWSRPDGWTRDSINISGLTSGAYTLTFRDNFGCPAAGLQRTFYLLATDNEAPYINPKADQTLLTDLGGCDHTILAAEELTLLPVIENIDGHDCDWTTTWDIFSFSTSTGATGLPSLVGYDLELGRNLITVYVVQNGYTNSASFNVYVEDNENPEAIAQVLSDITLNGDVGNGNITIAAEDFNNGSNDNCTGLLDLRYEISTDNGGSFNDSAYFTCLEINTPAQVVLRVRDENGNYDDSDTYQVTVNDNTAPVFLQPMREYQGNCATTNDAFGVGFVTGIDGLYLLLGIDYDDNCAVDFVEHRVIHTTMPQYNYPLDGSWLPGDDASAHTYYEGTSVIEFQITDPSGNVTVPTVMLQVVVLEMPTPGGVGGN
jgi:hypothetical protein